MTKATGVHRTTISNIGQSLAMRSLLTATQVAELLGIHVNTVKHIPALELAYYRIGTRGDRRYEPEDVAAYKRSRRVGGPAILPYEVPVPPDNPRSDVELEPLPKGERCGAQAFDGLTRRRCKRPASYRRDGLAICKQHARLPIVVAFEEPT
jgi:hypothetical protein